MKIKVIFEDDDILLLDKPAGITVNRAETEKRETVQDWIDEKIFRNKQSLRSKKLKDIKILGENTHNILVSQYPNVSDFVKRSGIVHRIDKETSGLLLVAKNKESFEKLQDQFKNRKIKKVYMALVHGKVTPSIGEIKVPVGRLPWNRKRFGIVAQGREAVTRYRVIKLLTMNNEPFTLLELYPETGRTHQIRVHLKYLGHPIFADPLYAGRKTARNDRKILPRLFLHASKISFTHPKSGEVSSFESDLPKELKEILQHQIVRFNA